MALTNRKPAIAFTHAQQVPSKSRPGTMHHVTIHISAHCTCEGFAARQDCYHVRGEMATVGTSMAALPRKQGRQGR